MSKSFLNFAGRKIGQSYKPLIIPEMGINHGGSLKVAFKIVDAAKKCGAEIIKHQTIIPDEDMSSESKNIKLKALGKKKFIRSFEKIES